MKKLFFILLVFLLSACNQLTNDSTESDDLLSKETGSTIETMPEDMPSDFGFSVLFGVEKKNKINTFKDKVTKDLITDGTVTADVALTDEEMNEIYKRMKRVNIKETKKLVPDPINGSNCVKQPYEEDEWKIRINDETITYSISGTHCEPTDDAKQLLELRNFIFSKIRSKEEYIELPEPKGGYL